MLQVLAQEGLMEVDVPSSDLLMRKVKSLERQCGIQKALLVAIGVAIASLFILGSTGKQEDVMTGQRVVLKDENGRIRVLLKADGGEPGMGLFDENGELIALITIIEGMGTLRFRDSKGNLKCSLGQDRIATRLIVFDSLGVGCLEIGSYDFGPGLRLGGDDDWNVILYKQEQGGFSLAFRNPQDSIFYSIPPR